MSSGLINVLVTVSSPAAVFGGSTQEFYRGAGTFSGLTIRGLPGSALNLSVGVALPDGVLAVAAMAANLAIQIAPCM